MTSNAIRVQLPGGPIYAPALHEAALKIGARSGLPTKTTKAFGVLVDRSIHVLNSGNASTVTLEVTVHENSLHAKLTGKACTSPTKKLLKDLETRAQKAAQSFATKAMKSGFVITFEV